MTVRDVILRQLAAVVAQSSPLPLPEDVSDETMLDEFWLDSLSFAHLLAGIESELKCTPLTFFEGVGFPRTVGELVGCYQDKTQVVS